MMAIISRAAITVLLSAPAWTTALQLLPPALQHENGSASGTSDFWDITSGPSTIYLHSDLADTRDTDGLLLNPPSGKDFAEIFAHDLSSLTGSNWTLEIIDQLPDEYDGIVLGAFTGEEELTYENEKKTTEGYELIVSSAGAFIGGTGARGMWWGTRTLLQELMIRNDATLSVGRSVDAPAYTTRGYMVDAGRKWYTKDFLKEMCSFASFFKMSEFHYHLSDNYPLNRGKNDTWENVYSHFSLLPEDEDLLGIIHGRENETLSREDYSDLQSHCASRGVTVIPEIEAPGHCLYLTKWKPELALDKKDLLNLSHPETVPTIQRIWSEFLPWFDVKEVHVGADEYDPTYADDYINFVNDMADFVNETSGKRIRIWGTPTDPPKEPITINEDIIIQHWKYGQSDPRQIVADGHEIINSEDRWAYMGLKNDHMPILPAKYPQFFNESRVLNFADEEGWQWQPADFNNVNTTQQLNTSEPLNKGSILAAWNDNGPDASTQLEMYYTMRRGIALIGARAWSGARGPKLIADDVSSSIDYYSPLAPGQNLDRVLRPQGMSTYSTKPLVTWTAPKDNTLVAGGNQTVTLGYGSKGMNYTLSLSVTGPFELSSSDVKLSLDDEGNFIFNADGYQYPLRHVDEQSGLKLDPGHPGRIWVNVSDSTHEPVMVKPGSAQPLNITIATDVLHGSVVWIDDEFAGRFEVFVYGGKNTQFSWSQMAFVAPLQTVTGTGLKNLEVVDHVNFPENGDTSPPPPSTPPPQAGSAAISLPLTTMVVLAIAAIALL